MALLIFLYPFAEIYSWYLFIEHFSFGDALLLAITTGALGFFIMTLNGKVTLMSMQASVTEGKVPPGNIMHQAAIMVGGLFLIVPGIISKILGTLLILPGTRHILVLWFKYFIAGKISKGAFQVFTAGNKWGFAESPTSNEGTTERDVIEIKPKSVEHQPKGDSN